MYTSTVEAHITRLVADYKLVGTPTDSDAQM